MQFDAWSILSLFPVHLHFYCLYYLTIKVEDISIIIYIPHVLLKDEKEENKSLKVINWKKGTEGVIFKDKSVIYMKK